MRKIHEGSTGTLTVEFRDSAGVVVVPSAVTYSIYCETNGQSIRGDTSVTPAATVSIVLAASDNAIIDSGNATETRLVTVEATLPGSLPLNSEYRYKVVNLSQV
jgi:hypothetical protein